MAGTKERTPALLRVGEAAEQLRLSERTLWRLLKTGELRSIRIGRQVRIRPVDVEAFVHARIQQTHDGESSRGRETL